MDRNYQPPASVTITAYYALSLPEYHMPFHTHESCEIMYVTSGRCLVFCPEETHTLTANQFIFLRSGTPHRLEIGTGHPCAILNLEFSFRQNNRGIPLDELIKGCPSFLGFWDNGEPYFVADDMRNMGYSMKDLITQLQKKEKDSSYLLRLLFYRTMVELSYCAWRGRKVPGILYLKKACSYIDQNLLEPLSVPEIAAQAGINKSYLQLLFSRLMNCSIGEYITKKRMEQAAFLLTNSSLGITDTAFSCGYNSRQHFSHTFEKFYHMSPSAYRKLHARSLDPDTEGARLLLDEDGKERRQSMKIPPAGLL